jgi:Chemotaxis phosphatase CheX
MPDTLRGALTDAGIGALENMAWLFAEQCSHASGGERTGPTARVEFFGATSGALLLQVEAPLLAVVTGAMLGTDDTPDLVLQGDALGELANVVCGHVLPEIAGTREEYALAPPAVFTDWEAALRPTDVVAEVVHLEAGGGWARVGFVRLPSPMRPEGLEPPTF